MIVPEPLEQLEFGPCRVAFCGRQPGSASAAPSSRPWNPPLAWNRQVHGATVLEVCEPGEQGAADGLVTATAHLALVVQTADCVPVVLFGAGRLAAVHAGWRGLAGGVIERAMELVPGLERVWIGPAIGPCCYEVGPEVAEQFGGDAAGRVRPGSGDRYFLDVAGIAADRCAGAAEVVINRSCTYCDDRWWSYRRGLAVGRSGAEGRNLSLAWLESDT